MLPLRYRDHARSGFLLIEVVLAMSVMILVVIAVYQIMQVSIMAGEEVRQSKKRSQEINGLVELIRRELGGLPNEATVTSSVREGGATGFAQELIFTDDPLAFSFGATSAHYGPKSIILVPQVGGLNSIAVEYNEDPESRNRPPAGSEPPVLILMRDIFKLEWLFYDQRSASWVEKWEQPNLRPKLVRMALTMPGATEEYIATFKVPEGGAAPAQASGQQPPGDNNNPGNPEVSLPQIPESQ